MLLRAALAAWRQVLSRPFRGILLKSIALTVGLLGLVWFGLTRLFASYLEDNPLSTQYPILDGFAFFLAGAGLFVALAYVLPAVSALVAGFFSDDAAEIVERTDFSGDPLGRALPVGRALLYGLRFAGLSLIVNLAALTLFFIPVVNVAAFFGANAYLLGREYFELAAPSWCICTKGYPGAFCPTGAPPGRGSSRERADSGAMVSGVSDTPSASRTTSNCPFGRKRVR
jgi:CysZ protein